MKRNALAQAPRNPLHQKHPISENSSSSLFVIFVRCLRESHWFFSMYACLPPSMPCVPKRSKVYSPALGISKPRGILQARAGYFQGMESTQSLSHGCTKVQPLPIFLAVKAQLFKSFGGSNSPGMTSSFSCTESGSIKSVFRLRGLPPSNVEA